MLHKTRGVVLNFIKYGETSVIVKIYTELFGIQSYIVNGVRAKGPKSKIAFFQPFTLLNLIVYHKHNHGLNRISEINCEKPFHSIPFDIQKTSIALFIVEVLTKTLKEESADSELFDFLSLSAEYLDNSEANFENFHLEFLIQLSGHLGFFLSTAKEPGLARLPFLPGEKEAIEKMILGKYQSDIKISNSLRRSILERLLLFYKLHVENFGDLNSVTILKEVLR